MAVMTIVKPLYIYGAWYGTHSLSRTICAAADRVKVYKGVAIPKLDGYVALAATPLDLKFVHCNPLAKALHTSIPVIVKG